MRILLAGAAGVIGRQMVPLLRAAGHAVFGTTRHAERTALLRALGAEPVLLDALDGGAVQAAVEQVRPDAIIHQLTSLATRDFAANNRLRIEGTRHLVTAAHSVGVERLVAQSLALYAAGPGYAQETDPLAGPEVFGGTTDAVRALEQAVSELPQAVVLRYGTLYGPETWFGPGGTVADQVFRGELPVSDEITSFVHVADAAAAAVEALHWPSGIVNIVDDAPAAASEWVPWLAALLGAPAPPTRAAQAPEAAGPRRGVSNARARIALGWQPRFPSWREGFATTFLKLDASSA